MYAPFVPVPKMEPMSAGPFWYERESRVPTVWMSASDHTLMPSSLRKVAATHVIHKRTAADVHVLAVKSILEEANDVVADSVLGGETLRPRQELTRVESGLLDGETGRQLRSLVQQSKLVH